MLHEIMHVGVTVTDLDRSLAFYRTTLGLRFQGELVMQGETTDRLFQRTGCKVRVAYLNGSEDLMAPPVELLQFVDDNAEKVPADLHRTSISEICFRVSDLDRVYAQLRERGVDFLSEPQFFDFSDAGFGTSKAVYFRDPDGNILELMQSPA